MNTEKIHPGLAILRRVFPITTDRRVIVGQLCELDLVGVERFFRWDFPKENLTRDEVKQIYAFIETI